jgi:hypothetical protein
VTKRLKDEETVREVNETESSDDNDYMGELDDDIFELPSGKEFCRINLDQTTTIHEENNGLEKVKEALIQNRANR